MKRNTQIFTVLFLVFLIFFAFFLVLPVFNIPQFLDSLKNTNPIFFFLACIVMLFSNAFGALRWSVIIAEVHAPKSAQYSNAFGVYSLGQIAGLFVPSRVGNYAKVPIVMKQDSISYEAGLSAVNAETIIDLAYMSLAGIVSFGILSLVFYSSFQLPLLFLLLSLGAILFGIFILLNKLGHFNEMYKKTQNLASQIRQPFWKRVPAHCLTKLFEMTQSTRDIFTNRQCVVKSGIYTLCLQLSGILSFFLIIESVHAPLPFIIVYVIYTISTIAGIISLIPGGFGASDLSQIVLLASQGISLPVATNIVILWRVVMYFPIVLVIGIYFLKTRLWFENM